MKVQQSFMKTSTGALPLHYVSSFHFNNTKPCFCRSGKNFGDCCGNSDQYRQPPKHLTIVPNFISKTDCRRLIRFLKKQKSARLQVVTNKHTNNNTSNQKKNHSSTIHNSRITQQISLARKQETVNQWFKSACTNSLAPTIRSRPEWIETPHLLHYGPGGKYDIHADAEHFDERTKQFFRFIDRDFSMLLYLNDDYTGGELNFPWLNYQYKPVSGDLVFFPSNHIFTHQSLPITSGNKYAAVTWGALYGSPRVRQPRSMLSL